MVSRGSEDRGREVREVARSPRRSVMTRVRPALEFIDDVGEARASLVRYGVSICAMFPMQTIFVPGPARVIRVFICFATGSAPHR